MTTLIIRRTALAGAVDLRACVPIVDLIAMHYKLSVQTLYESQTL